MAGSIRGPSEAIFNAGLVPNVKENPPQQKDAEARPKRLRLRFEFNQQRHYGIKPMGYTLST
jgi:hypothetical protein